MKSSSNAGENNENLRTSGTVNEVSNVRNTSNDDSTCGERMRALASDMRVWLLAGAALVFLIAFGFGFLAGFLARGNQTPQPQTIIIPTEPRLDYNSSLVESLKLRISGKSIEQYLFALTNLGPRPGGSRAAQVDALRYLESTLARDAPALNLTRHTFTRIYVPKPQTRNGELCNKIEIHNISSAGDVLYSGRCNITYVGGDGRTKTYFPYFGYSKTADLTRPVRFVYAMSTEEFEDLLANATHYNLSGSIALVPFSGIFRGAIVEFVAQLGAEAALIYPDPFDGYNLDADLTYPRARFLPPDAMADGTAKNLDGDPLSPGIPAIDPLYRLAFESREFQAQLPRIPSHPLSYTEARLLVRLAFARNLDDPSTRHSIHFAPPMPDVNVRVLTNERVDGTEAINNVVLKIDGSLEPDCYVIFGAHFDAWSDGAYDPAGATSIILEIAKTLSSLVASNQWRPRRTILLVFWDAEEHGCIGSTEFVERFAHELDARLVAYLNLDTIIEDQDALDPSMHPLLARLLFDAARRLVQPDARQSADVACPPSRPPSNSSVYDWIHWRARENNATDFENEPPIDTTPGGSDQGPFWTLLSALFVHPSYNIAPRADGRASLMPMYHTYLESFDLATRLNDPGDAALELALPYHATIARLMLDVLLALSDSARLPLSAHHLAKYVRASWASLAAQRAHQLAVLREQRDWRELEAGFESELDLTGQAATRFDALPTPKESMALRMLNDRAMSLAKAFTSDYNREFRETKNLLFAIPTTNGYGVEALPGLAKALRSSEPDRANAKRELSALVLALRDTRALLDGRII